MSAVAAQMDAAPDPVNPVPAPVIEPVEDVENPFIVFFRFVVSPTTLLVRPSSILKASLISKRLVL